MEKNDIQNQITQKKKKNFLEIFAKTGNVTLSATAVGWKRSNAYYHKNSDKEFSKEWDNAREEAADRLEYEAYRRAVLGIDEPVYYKGELIDYIKKYSDTLLIFLLKGVHPEKYRENHKIDTGIDKQSLNSLAKMLEEANGKTRFDVTPEPINNIAEIEFIGAE